MPDGIGCRRSGLEPGGHFSFVELRWSRPLLSFWGCSRRGVHAARVARPETCPVAALQFPLPRPPMLHPMCLVRAGGTKLATGALPPATTTLAWSAARPLPDPPLVERQYHCPGSGCFLEGRRTASSGILAAHVVQSLSSHRKVFPSSSISLTSRIRRRRYLATAYGEFSPLGSAWFIVFYESVIHAAAP